MNKLAVASLKFCSKAFQANGNEKVVNRTLELVHVRVDLLFERPLLEEGKDLVGSRRRVSTAEFRCAGNATSLIASLRKTLLS